MTENNDFEEGGIPLADGSTLVRMVEAEINQQVATAKRFPRSVSRFLVETKTLATVDQPTAEECMYTLPRDGKAITGPSARFAEIVASCWGNCRVDAEVVAVEDKFLVAQGTFYDCERNVGIRVKVQRRITDKNGRRYKDDMIGVTGMAAVSIALRNAVLKGVPKAFWAQVFEGEGGVVQTIRGTNATLADRRAKALDWFAKHYAISAERICAKLEVGGIEDIGLDALLVLNGMRTALKDGDSKVDELFPEDARTGAAGLNDKIRKAAEQDAADASNEKKEPAGGSDKPEPRKRGAGKKGAQAAETADTKPPTQTIGGASVGETTETGNATVAQDEAAPKDSETARRGPPPGADDDSGFNLE